MAQKNGTHGRIGDALVLVGSHAGHTVVPVPTPLTRLNFFDGKFLRADDLRLEQQYLRALVGLSNQAGGSGVVHGFDLTLQSGDALGVGAGLAMDGAGRALLLPNATAVSVAALLEASRRRTETAPRARRVPSGVFDDCEVVSESPPSDGPRGSDLHLITIGHAEALCGEEDVYGRLCEDACATSTDRPYRIEGVVIRATPLTLRTPLTTSRSVSLDRRHLRSQVASAYFADEALAVGQLISRDGLAQESWCLGADAPPAGDVALGVLARAGATTVFLDAWSARRERIEPPPRRYWAWRMRMRPWDVYLAHILQFQCQLRDVLERAPEPGGGDDPCAPQNRALTEASEYLNEIERALMAAREGDGGAERRSLPMEDDGGFLPGGIQRIRRLSREVGEALRGSGAAAEERMLIRRGIVELPSAGYLPVVPGSNVSVNTQVRRLLGEGLDLRFCVVRPDFVAHALEAAQHMERISLLRGLDDPARREAVDVLVPDGSVVAGRAPAGLGFATRLTMMLPDIRIAGDQVGEGGAMAGGQESSMTGAKPAGLQGFKQARSVFARSRRTSRAAFCGVGRAEPLPTGGGAFHFAGTTTLTTQKEGAVEEALKYGTLTGRTISGMDTASQPEPAAPSDADQPTWGAMPQALYMENVSYVREEPLASFEEAPDVSLSGWATVRCERSPFTMARGETTRLRGEGALSSALREHAMCLDVEVDGALYITEPARGSGPVRRVRARITRARLSATTLLNGAEVQAEATRASFDVELVLTATAGAGSTLDVTLRHEDGFAVSIRSAWSGDPLTAKLEVSAVREKRDLDGQNGDDEPDQVAAARANQDPEVFDAAHPLHVRALTALARIERALRQPGFEAGARALLFPAVPTLDTLTLHATRDWVLFHRRRDKQCAPVARVPQPPRRYQLYHVRVSGDAELRRLREVLRRGGGLDAFDVEAVAAVDFAPAFATLLTEADELRASWMQVRPGARVAYGAVVSDSAAALAEGAEVARDRLREAALSLGPVSALDPAAALEVLSLAPSPLSPAGSDGVMLFVTRAAEVEGTCHDVLRAEPEEWAVFMRLFQAGDLAGAVSLLSKLVHETRLGEVRFAAGTDTILDGSGSGVVEKWADAVGQPPSETAVVLLPGRTPDSAHWEQGRAIGTLVGQQATPVVVDLRPFGQQVPLAECPMMTVLVTRR